jgi:hypothetical protein
MEYIQKLEFISLTRWKQAQKHSIVCVGRKSGIALYLHLPLYPLLKNGNRFSLTKNYTFINLFANNAIRKIQQSKKALKRNVKRSDSFNYNIKVS